MTSTRSGCKRGDGFQAGVDGAADFGFFLGVGREIAVVGVSDETILETESVEGLGEVGGERDDAVDGLRDANGAAGFVGDFAEGGGRRGSDAAA